MIKPKPNASEHQRYQAELRKPQPVRKLSAEEIRTLEHRRNVERYLKKLR